MKYLLSILAVFAASTANASLQPSDCSSPDAEDIFGTLSAYTAYCGQINQGVSGVGYSMADTHEAATGLIKAITEQYPYTAGFVVTPNGETQMPGAYDSQQSVEFLYVTTTHIEAGNLVKSKQYQFSVGPNVPPVVVTFSIQLNKYNDYEITQIEAALRSVSSQLKAMME